MLFIHGSNSLYYYYNEKNKNNEISINYSFIIKKKNGIDFIEYYISPCFDCRYYSILNICNLICKSDEGYNIINIYLKELNGEIVGRIKKRKEYNNNNYNIREERRRYEKERINEVFYVILKSLKDLTEHTFEDKNKVYLGYRRGYYSYMERKEEIKEDKDYLSDIIEEEDLGECLILYLKCIREKFNYFNNKYESELSFHSEISNDILKYK